MMDLGLNLILQYPSKPAPLSSLAIGVILKHYSYLSTYNTYSSESKRNLTRT
jgi:hypothetical protein